MEMKRAKAVVSVCELEHPIQFCNQLGVDGSMDGFIELGDMKRTQDLEPYYRLNGAIYFLSREYANRLSELYSEGTYSYIMGLKSSIDIDVDLDFKLAEFFITNGD